MADRPAARPWLGVGIGLALVALGALYLTGRRELTIIVVSLDTTRPDHLSPYGYDRDTTPTLARLAEEGARFLGARSTTSWTLPSHMSLFTGQPPAVHDVVIDFHELHEDIPTMGELFDQAGYETAGFYSAPYVHERFGFGRGMDFYEGVTVEPMMFDLPPATVQRRLGALEQQSHAEVTSRRVVQQAVRFLKTRARDRNLLFLHFFDPHYDFHPPARFRDRFRDTRYHGPVDGEDVTRINEPPPPTPADLAQLRALYDAELAWVDANLRALVQTIEALGMEDEVLLVVTGDHGEEIFEHGRFGHRAGLYDEVLRVPLLLWGPSLVPAGTVVEEDVALYDVLPTLLDYAGLSPKVPFTGRSLRPLVEGASLPPRPTSAALTFIPYEPDGYYEQHDALVFEDLKVIRTLERHWDPASQFDLGGEVDPSRTRLEVFDLEADPGETRDLVEAGDPRVGRALRALEETLAEQEALARRLVPSRRAPVADLGLDYQQMLGALGYAGEVRSSTEAGAGAPAEGPGDGSGRR